MTLLLSKKQKSSRAPRKSPPRGQVAESGWTLPFAPPTWRFKAHVIRSDAEAIAVARKVAGKIKAMGADRRREGKPPKRQLELVSQSGLAGINVPRSHGGPEVSTVTLAEVLKLLSASDPGVGQILVAQYSLGDVVTSYGDEGQKGFFLPLFLRGGRVANAMSETGGQNSRVLQTRLVRSEGGGYLLNGRKFYTTGSYLAHWFPVLALNDADVPVFAYVARNQPGVVVLDDWKGIGQKNTLSGTAIFNDVKVEERFVISAASKPHSGNTYAQILHAAVDTGIAQGALDEAIWFLKTHSRPWRESDVERAAEEPHVIRQIGEWAVLLHAAEALVRRGAEFIDAARRDPSDERAQSEAVLAVADARVQSDHAALTISSGIFSLLGARSSFEKWNLDRFWRNARAHTVHDPIRWKLHHIGNFLLNGVPPQDLFRKKSAPVPAH